MKRILFIACLGVVFHFCESESNAQYGYGWGGWGGGGTVAGNNARGLGAFSAGRGMYNLDTAQARSINANTAMQWNEYIFQSQMATNRRYHERIKEKSAANNKSYDEIQDRLRNHPETRDILSGDALNTQLDLLLNPANVGRAVQSIRTPLRHDLIPMIPFEVASEGLTICLDSMTSETDWPLALRPETFKPERDALEKAAKAALKEDETGNLEPETIANVQTALDQLKAKFEKQVPETSPDFIPARNKLKAMAGIVRMLENDKVEKVLAELEDYQGTTLGDLLSFMQGFNLRFANANSYRQRQIYLKLYPMLAEQTAGLGSQAAGAVADMGQKSVQGLKSAATDLFKDMSWQNLSGKTPPPPPPAPIKP